MNRGRRYLGEGELMFYRGLCVGMMLGAMLTIFTLALIVAVKGDEYEVGGAADAEVDREEMY